jgi:hypothetical protein
MNVSIISVIAVLSILTGGYRLLSNDDQQILIAPSWEWLSMLP